MAKIEWEKGDIFSASFSDDEPFCKKIFFGYGMVVNPTTCFIVRKQRGNFSGFGCMEFINHIPEEAELLPLTSVPDERVRHALIVAGLFVRNSK